MQNARTFADHLEELAESEALLGQADYAPLSPSLIVAVRRLILEGTSLPEGEVVAGAPDAMRALRDLDRPLVSLGSYSHPILGPLSRSALEWADFFRRIAQRIRAAVEAAEAAQRVGDPEANCALAEFLARQPSKITREEMVQAVTTALGRTPAPAEFDRLWGTVPHDRKHTGRPRGSRRTPTPQP